MADEKQRQRQHFSVLIPGGTATSPKKQSLRDYYGEDEQVYIMDAKKAGNIGRFLNVSYAQFFHLIYLDLRSINFLIILSFYSHFLTFCGQRVCLSSS